MARLRHLQGSLLLRSGSPDDLEGGRRYLRECLLHHPDSSKAQARLAELESN